VALLVGAGDSLAPATTASAASRPSAAARGRAIHTHLSTGPARDVLYDQNDNENGVAIVSQNFETEYDAYDDASADDFTVPANTIWKIKRILVTGTYFDGAGVAVSETVTFYKNSVENGLPGDPITSVTVTGQDKGGFGFFDIPLGLTVKLKGGRFGGRTYWVSVVANMDFEVAGEWGWVTRNIQNGHPSAWQNPADGFATGCTTWNTTNACIGTGEGPDYMFTLYGRAET
jgi:hypothetical protein